MTQKLKRKIKKMIKTMLIIIGGAVTFGYLSFAGLQTLNGEENFVKTLADTVVALAEGTNNEIVTPKSSTAAVTGTTTIAADGAIVCDSIMEGVRDIDLVDGNYTLRVKTVIDGVESSKDYAIELYNFYSDMHYTKNTQIGSSTADTKMLVAKYWGDLTIDSGVTLTAKARKKGMYIHIAGNLENNGTITMTARGAIAEGENVYLLKNADGSYEYIPAVGGAGAAKRSYTSKSTSSTDYHIAGITGTAGTNRATGGGGSGAITARRYNYGSFTRNSGAGSAGTSYSGGSGGGGIDTNYSGTYSAGSGAANGGKRWRCNCYKR